MPHRAGFKPYGLWYEVEGADDWQWFCRDAFFRNGLEDCYKYEIKIGDECNILKISNIPALAAFTAVWGFEPEWVRDWRLKSKRLFPGVGVKYSIDWEGVQKAYDGIEIAPYQWSRRLNDNYWWYYGWDVASGCLWRPKNTTTRMLRRPIRKASRGKSRRKVDLPAI
jgi:hypothetical protein